jgi:hypothetical protein
MAYCMFTGDLEYLSNGHWVRQFHMYLAWVSYNHLADAIICLQHRRAWGAGSRLSSQPILAPVHAPSVSLDSQLNFSKFQYPKLAHFSCPVFRNNHRGMQITVSAHRSSANGIAAQFFSVFGSGFMLALYPSIKDRLKLKIPALSVLFRPSAFHPFIFRAILIHLGSGW